MTVKLHGAIMNHLPEPFALARHDLIVRARALAPRFLGTEGCGRAGPPQSRLPTNGRQKIDWWSSAVP